MSRNPSAPSPGSPPTVVPIPMPPADEDCIDQFQSESGFQGVATSVSPVADARFDLPSARDEARRQASQSSRESQGRSGPSLESFDLHPPDLADVTPERSHFANGALALAVSVVLGFAGWYLIGSPVHGMLPGRIAPTWSSPETPAGPDPAQIPRAQPVSPSGGAPDVAPPASETISEAPTVAPSAPKGASTGRAIASTLATTGGLDGAMSVDSHPAGANVYIDGQLVGKTPVSLPQVGPGSHVIRLELDAHRGWSSSVRVAPGGQNRVTASLEEEN
jgi:hypothetical protein